MLTDRLQIWIKIWRHITGLHITILPFSKHFKKQKFVMADGNGSYRI